MAKAWKDLTVKDLLSIITEELKAKNITKDSIVILSSDSEGNNFSALYSYGTEKLNEVLDDREENKDKCLVLWP